MKWKAKRGWRLSQARTPAFAGQAFGVLVGRVIVENDVNQLPGRHICLDGIEKADELLMSVALHAAADDLAFEHVEGGEQRGRAVALIIVGHGLAAALLDWQSRLGAVKGLNLRLLVDRQHDGVGRWVDVQADDVTRFAGKGGIVGELEQVYAGGVASHAPAKCAAPN